MAQVVPITIAPDADPLLEDWSRAAARRLADTAVARAGERGLAIDELQLVASISYEEDAARFILEVVLDGEYEPRMMALLDDLAPIAWKTSDGLRPAHVDPGMMVDIAVLWNG